MKSSRTYICVGIEDAVRLRSANCAHVEVTARLCCLCHHGLGLITCASLTISRSELLLEKKLAAAMGTGIKRYRIIAAMLLLCVLDLWSPFYFRKASILTVGQICANLLLWFQLEASETRLARFSLTEPRCKVAVDQALPAF